MRCSVQRLYVANVLEMYVRLFAHIHEWGYSRENQVHGNDCRRSNTGHISEHRDVQVSEAAVVLWGQIHDLHTAQCVLQDVYTSQLGGTHTCLLSSALPIVDLHPPPFNTRFFRPISESVPKLAHDLFSHFCTAHQYAHIHRPKHVILCAIIIPRPIQVTYGKGNE